MKKDLSKRTFLKQLTLGFTSLTVLPKIDLLQESKEKSGREKEPETEETAEEKALAVLSNLTHEEKQQIIKAYEDKRRK